MKNTIRPEDLSRLQKNPQGRHNGDLVMSILFQFLSLFSSLRLITLLNV